MNQVNLIGYLGDDFVADYTPAGKCYAKNSLAISKRYINAKGNEETQTTWIPIVIFGKAAEIAYLHFPKGFQFACSGEIRSGQYIDEKSGEKRTSYSVIVRNFYWLKGNKAEETTTAKQNAPKPEPKKVQTQKNREEAEALDQVDISETETGELPF